MCDPNIYIDVMEFMYICLSLGFGMRKQHDSHEFNQEQLERVTHSLYKRIRAYRGNFSKVLSPVSIKQRQSSGFFGKKQHFRSAPLWIAGITVFVGACLVFHHTFFSKTQNSTKMELVLHEKSSEHIQ